MRTPYFIRCLCVCAAYYSGAVHAQYSDDEAPKSHSNSAGLSLKSALVQTLEHNPQLYQFNFINEQLSAEKETSSRRPSLALEFEIENFAGTGSTAGFDAAEASLALSSVIELGGKRKARMNVMDLRMQREQWRQQALTLDVLGALTTEYIEALATQANILLAEEARALSRTLLRTAEQRAERGASSEAEVMRASAAHSREEIRLSALRYRFNRQKILLARFWGETEIDFSVLEGPLFHFGKDEAFEDLYARVLESPALQVFASEARLKDAELSLAKARTRSDLTWRLGIKQLEENNESAFVFGLSVPLFSQKQNQGALKAALAERNTVDYQQRKAVLDLHAKLYQAYSLRKQNIDVIHQTQKSVIPALERSLMLTQKAYEEGRSPYLDLISAQEELLEVKQALIDAATNALVSQALIEQLTSESLIN